MFSRRRWTALTLFVLASLLSCQPVAAQFPRQEPTNQELVFGCNPGPIEPFYREDPPLPPEPVPTNEDPAVAETLVVDGGITGNPIAGAGFNLEHTLWSCQPFHASMRRRLLEPFRPAIARVDTGQLPLAPDGVPAEQLTPDQYQAIMAAPRYQPSWEMLRRLNRQNVQVLLGVWGAPGAFTDDGTRRGTLLPQYYDKYVEYYEAIVDYLVRVKGLSVFAATIMNEPDGGDGTYIAPDDFAEVARRLGPRLAAYGVKLYGPDTASSENALEYLRPMLDDPDIMPYMGAVATHQYYPSSFTERLVETVRESGYDLPVYITEYTSFSFGDLDRGEDADDEVGFMLDIAATAVAHYNDGVDAAIYWDAVDYFQAGHAAITRWGLLQGPAEAFFPRKRYFGMLQILPYLQPGAQLLGRYVAGDQPLPTLAIRTPGDGRTDLAIAIVNQGGPV
ncbi:MAG: hypothetical protein IT307_13750, partial [Chloroflexi bacterium]|nr:hypothetical protein [Chloroflexota bacterium]